MAEVFLGLGSNRKYNSMNPVEILWDACLHLKNILHNMECSSVYRTKALYVTDQSDFYNMAVRGTIDECMTPFELLAVIHEIETSFGRDRSREIRFGPRTLDIDIELFDAVTVSSEDLQIPHPRLFERKFVLVPLLELLHESADIVDREKFTAALRKLDGQQVDLFMTSGSFKKYPEAENGTGCSG